MTEKMVNRVKGTILGLVSRGQFLHRELVAFFYPSLVLPRPPEEWNEKEYPYAEIEQSYSTGNYVFIVQTTSSIRLANGFKYSAAGSYLLYKVVDGAWVLDGNGTYEQGETFTGDDQGKVWWSNYDILNENETVYLEAFNPIFVGNGMAVYRGSRLPKLPEWDMEHYPYAYIFDDRSNTNAWYLVVLSEKAFHHDWWLEIINSGFSVPGEYGDETELISYKCDAERMKWEYYNALSANTVSWAPTDILVWANKNIPHCEYDSANNVYVESGVHFVAFEPVPIYGGD